MSQCHTCNCQKLFISLTNRSLFVSTAFHHLCRQWHSHWRFTWPTLGDGHVSRESSVRIVTVVSMVWKSAVLLTVWVDLHCSRFGHQQHEERRETCHMGTGGHLHHQRHHLTQLNPIVFLQQQRSTRRESDENGSNVHLFTSSTRGSIPAHHCG